ncbi:MAG: class I SAM-dependent methyltransferase [Candidatus Spechtbacterales bacterium]|nr:class I SAM-dependent methyltransferase [Candidatus Spechtbacterales bacterium]
MSERELEDKNIYLERMAKPLAEKLRVVHFIPAGAKVVLDVGCADGTVTCAMAEIFPNIEFLGIDLDGEFIEKARKKAKEKNLDNVKFEKIYLRELLARKQRYSAVFFISVLHEFYTYGEGISSVLKALSDAHELLEENGEIIIRDMILNEYTKNTDFRAESILNKIRSGNTDQKYIDDFESAFGEIDNIYKLNHFLLKYFYIENWERECKEHYVPVTFEQYQDIFSLLGMDLQYMHSYLIEFLRGKWVEDFGLTGEELDGLRSTGFVVARKK